MLSALQEGASARPAAKPRGQSGGKAWWWAAGLAVAATAGFLIYAGTDATGDAPVAEAEPASPALVAAAMTTAPPGAAEAPLVAPPPAALPAAPPAVDAAASEALAASEPTGPAQLEIRNDGVAALPGMAAAAQAVAAERANAASDAAVPAEPLASAAAAAPVVAQALPKSTAASATRADAHAHPARHGAVAKKPTTKASARKSSPTGKSTPADPDAELVAAIMARMEGAPSSGERAAGSSGERGNTIAALVRDCNALPDSGSALACRRRICDGYWGKAQACPRSMAPQAAAAANSSSTAAAR